MYNFKSFTFLFILVKFAFSNAQSLRGLSVLNDTQVWVSGSNGCIGRLNADTLEVCNVPDEYRNKDFRDIHAFSQAHAIAMSVSD